MISINDQMCKGCGYCVNFCPKNILSMGQTRSARGFFFPVQAEKEKCTSCGICALMCPEGAIEISSKKDE